MGKKHLKLVSEHFITKVTVTFSFFLLFTPQKAMGEYYDHIQKMIETTIDIDAAQNHEFIIRHDFDPELGEIKEEKKKIFKFLENHMEKVHFFALLLFTFSS
jgi:DNA mismatch repair ATPase MutS